MGLRYAILIGYVFSEILLIIAASMGILRLSGFQVPETLASNSFIFSSYGLYCIFNSLLRPIRRDEKYWKLGLTAYLLGGICVLSTGIVDIAGGEMNIFTYPCLLLGVALLYLSLKRC